MLLAGLLLLLTITLVSALYGSRRLSHILTYLCMFVAIAVYLHHATDALNLSF